MTTRAPTTVSVVISNYNYGRFLSDCLRSVLAQEYSPHEIIVVDDGSTDNSLTVLAGFAGKVAVVTKTNGGHASAMNAGFAASTGEVVVFLDADDYLLPGALLAHASALSGTGTVRSQGYMAVVDAEGNPTGARVPGVTAPEGDLRSMVLRDGPGAYVSSPCSGNAWARPFLKSVFPLPETALRIGGDSYLMDVAPLFGTIVTLDRIVAAYRDHGTGQSLSVSDFTAATLNQIIAFYRLRASFLARFAGPVQTERWSMTNWRLVTLRYFYSKLSGKPTEIGLWAHLSAVWAAKVVLPKRLALTVLVCAIRLAPQRYALNIGRRAIRLRYM